MRWILLIGVGLLVAAGLSTLWAQANPPEPPKFSSDAERHAWILNTFMPFLEQFRAKFHNVPRSDGEHLRWVIVATKRRRALEIGTANGYSALWLGLGLEATKGRLTTVEIEPSIAKEAQANLKRAGMLDKVVTVVEGDALKVVPNLRGKFDFVFIDIGPRALPFFKAVEPKLTDDAIVAVHRPPSPGALSDLLDELKRRPEWWLTTVQTGAPTGIVLALRKSP
ncbi:MAG: class I SAM-dependent methyltransferase [Abditibacteriales bacterium]|nr:class I SAM-dependent methyltransferase [Abditibacteriales bacterium]MDW8365848.1 class I SAM-dependent methyltransferase [Abditibacteriales bacterium]